MRVATMDDFDEVKDMVLTFVKSTEYISKYYTESSLNDVITNLILGPVTQSLILISDDGFLAAKVVPFPFNPEILTASEVGWYVRPDSRGKGTGKDLLQAFEYWAKNVAGCKLVFMGCMDDKVGEYFTKKGYELAERAYIKEL